MKKLVCKLFGHKYKYNFISFPSKCKCTRCGKSWNSIKNPNYVGDLKEDIYIWVENNLQ